MAARKGSTAVAERTSSAVAVRQAPPMEIDASDVALPTLKKGESMATQVQDGLVAFGDLYSVTSKDDGDPQILLPFKDTAAGLKIHVLSMRKGKSVTIDGELKTFAFNDPEAPDDAWVTYMYQVAIPEVDSEVPYKMLLTKTGAPTAKQINLAIMKGSGAPWEQAFTLHVAKRSNQAGQKYCVMQVRSWVPETAAEIKQHEANVAIAADLAQIVAGTPASGPAPTGDTPDI